MNALSMFPNTFFGGRGNSMPDVCNTMIQCMCIEFGQVKELSQTCAYNIGCILLGLFRQFLFRYRNNRTYRISIPKRTDFVLF